MHVAQYMAMGQGLGEAISRVGQAMGTSYHEVAFVLFCSSQRIQLKQMYIGFDPQTTATPVGRQS